MNIFEGLAILVIFDLAFLLLLYFVEKLGAHDGNRFNAKTMREKSFKFNCIPWSDLKHEINMAAENGEHSLRIDMSNGKILEGKNVKKLYKKGFRIMRLSDTKFIIIYW